jgi:predicted Zn-dependent protease
MACLLAFTAFRLSAQTTSQKKSDPTEIGNRDVGKGINLYSLEKELALGKQIAQEIQRQAKVVDDPLISEYVNRIGQNLVRNSDAHVPFTFQVIEGDSPNAFALPGGYVFVYTGLIKIASEEDELAAAMAHEIAHVAARHMTRQATRSQIAGIATIPLIMLPGGGLARQELPVGLLPFTRAAEEEADYLGVQYLYAAGYDPNGAVSILEKLSSLERKSPGTVARIFSSHPTDAARIQKTEREIERILPTRSEYVVSTSEYAAIRQRLIDVPAKRRPTLESPRDSPTDADRPTLRRDRPE